MAIRADWRLAELDLDSDDPFATVILSTGLKVDLNGGEKAVQQGISESLRLEASLFNRGVTCDLKEAGQDCLTCTQYTADRAESRSRLCRLGRDQRSLVVRAEELSAERTAPYRELAEYAERFTEMLDGELLAAAG